MVKFKPNLQLNCKKRGKLYSNHDIEEGKGAVVVARDIQITNTSKFDIPCFTPV